MSDLDQNLVARCLAGEEDGFAELFQRHKSRSLRTSIALVGDLATAEEALQECSARGNVTHPLKEARPMDTVGPSVTVRFVLREDEIASAYRTLSLKRPLFWVVLLIGVYFLVQGALDLRGGDVLGNASIHFAGGLFLVGMIATIVFIYPRWQFRRNARARGEQSHEFSDEGFEVSLSDSRSVAKWTFYQQVIATSDLYLMLHNNRLCNILPRRAFANLADEAAFREILHRHTKLRTVGAADSRKATDTR